MNKAVELLPCPFSGKKAKLCKTRNEAGKIKYYVSCGDINTKSFTQARSAINVWNTRATPSIEAIIEKIEAERLYNETGNISCKYKDQCLSKAISIIREEWGK